jgi:hypothetical protein
LQKPIGGLFTIGAETRQTDVENLLKWDEVGGPSREAFWL